MKNIINTALLTSALFASTAFAGDLSSFGAHSVEANLATGINTHSNFENVDSPLSDLGVSREASLIADGNSTASNTIASHGLTVPGNSTEALL